MGDLGGTWGGRSFVRYGGEGLDGRFVGRNWGEGLGDDVGDGAYSGGGTKDALTLRPWAPSGPESIAACRSVPYLSWKLRRWLISIATALKSAAMPFNLGISVPCATGSRPQMMRHKSCCCSGGSDWIRATLELQTFRNEMNAGGQLVWERSRGCDVLLCRGRGTEGGVVVHRSAAK